MVDNQHKKITGYRDLTEEEINLMNEAKELAEQVGMFVNKLQFHENSTEPRKELDQRWIATGKTDLQKGFMSVIRGIAQPTTFCGGRER